MKLFPGIRRGRLLVALAASVAVGAMGTVSTVTGASPDAMPPGPSAAPVAGPAGVWVPTGSMGTPRSHPTAVRLLDGRVLVAGGDADQGSSSTSAELYDPATATWSPTGSMVHPHAGFPATLLPDGRVLIGDVRNPAARVWNTGAEVYDPGSGTWSSLGKVFRTEAWESDMTATLLRDGRVLVAGQDGAKVYDPDNGTWSATGPMIEPRHHHTATLLRDGRVLVAGGTDAGDSPMSSAELYDPDTGSWIATEQTPHDRGCGAGCQGTGGIATLLPDGTVLFVRSWRNRRTRAEIYHPATGTWTQTVDRPDTSSPTLTRLPDGTVLAAGGVIPPKTVTAEVYDPASGSWTRTADMPFLPASATLLSDGTVLVAGGFGLTSGDTGSSELYVPAGVTPSEPGPATASPAVSPAQP